MICISLCAYYTFVLIFTSLLQQSNIHNFHYQLLALCICTYYSKLGVIDIKSASGWK